MGYTHKLVSDALTKQQAGAALLPESTIRELRDKIKQSIRGLQFINRDRRSLYIYRDDCPYVLGWIGYGDYRRGGDGTEMYVVHSRTINNGKYTTYNDQHFMAMSTNIDTALRNVKKYIRPYAPVDMAKIHIKDVSSEVSNVAVESMTRLRDIESSIVDLGKYGDNSATRLITELRHLITIGHKFVDPSFGSDVADYLTARVEADKYKGRSMPMWFVRVYERFGDQCFDVASICDINTFLPKIGEEVHRYTASDLPEDIMGKLSVLNILNDKQYVDDVGYRVGEGMFYVVR